jgi:hypothetical protein
MSSVAATKFVVGASSLFAGLAALACLIVIPSLFSKINEIQMRVNDGVQVSLKNMSVGKKSCHFLLIFGKFIKNGAFFDFMVNSESLFLW